MAGWDGDDLAGQAEDAAERRQQAAEERAQRSTSTPEERAREARREALRLSKARILDQLSRATNPAYRATLERALQSLDAQAED